MHYESIIQLYLCFYGVIFFYVDNKIKIKTNTKYFRQHSKSPSNYLIKIQHITIFGVKQFSSLKNKGKENLETMNKIKPWVTRKRRRRRSRKRWAEPKQQIDEKTFFPFFFFVFLFIQNLRKCRWRYCSCCCYFHLPLVSVSLYSFILLSLFHSFNFETKKKEKLDFVVMMLMMMNLGVL